ncbi:MAG: hypothetical protein ACI4V5_08925 [Prevotella sp.]
MRKIKIRLNDNFSYLSAYIKRIPDIFDDEGKTIYKERNEVKLMILGCQKMAVKRFKHLGLYKKLIYFRRKSKAEKAYNNACLLKERGICTPEPIAYIETRNFCGFLLDAYYICEYVDMPPISDYLLPSEKQFDKLFSKSFALFVAQLHDKGVLHHDLNSTNVRYRRCLTGFEYMLIDINRMTIYKHGHKPSLHQCFLNMTRFSHLSDMFKCFVSDYLHERSLDETLFNDAIAVKEKHDKAYKRRKIVTGYLKRLM